MTKVKMTPSLLQYFRGMAALVNELCEENALAEDDRERDPELVLRSTDVAELWVPGLLWPPKIETLQPDLYLKNGCLDGIIHINTSEAFGVRNVYVTLEDDQGNHIEGGFAMENELVKNHWGYIASAPAKSGTTIIVRAITMDRLGSVAIQQESITI